MNYNDDLKIDMSISFCTYDEKPKKDDYKTMFFQKEKLTSNKLLERIKKGHSFMSVLNNYSMCVEFNQKSKTEKRYQRRTERDILQTQFIGVDVDDSEIEMMNFIDKISIKPTIAYTTPNNLINGYRFRLIYILNNPIKEQSSFETLYHGLVTKIEEETETQLKDNCGAKIERLFNGNANTNIQTYLSNLIYDFEDFPKGQKKTSVTKIAKTKITENGDNFNKVFQSFSTMDIKDFIRAYKPYNEVIQQSKVKYNERGYSLLDDTYIEIKRFGKDGLIKKGIGEGRKKYLYNILQLKKKIKPNISIEELLFNAAFEIYYYIDNSDNKLTKPYIIDLVKNVFESETTIKTYTNTKTFKVSKGFCIEHNTTPNQYKCIVRKELHYQSIDEWYNKELTPNENYNNAILKGIKISNKTIYNFAKEKGYIKPNIDISEWYDDRLSVKENLQIAKDNDIKVSLAKLYNYCKQNNINSKGKQILSIINGITYYYNDNIPEKLKLYFQNHNGCCNECLCKIFQRAS